MSLFNFLETFFRRLFGKDGGVAQRIISDTSFLIQLAQPVVAEIETEVKAAPSTGISGAVGRFVAKYEHDAVAVQSTIEQFAPISGPVLWQQLASWAVGKLVPSGTAASAINFAIEFAYQMLLAGKPAAVASPATVTPIAAVK